MKTVISIILFLITFWCYTQAQDNDVKGTVEAKFKGPITDPKIIEKLKYIPQKTAKNKKIVGGTPVTWPTERPFQVSVYAKNAPTNPTSVAFCGGTIIHAQWAVFAAHCVPSFSPVYYDVRAGTIYPFSGGTLIPVSQVIKHENYSYAGLKNDIALIKFINPLKFKSTSLNKVRVSAAADILSGDLVTISGWGLTGPGITTVSSILNKVTVSTISNAQCASVFGSAVIQYYTACTSGVGPKGTGPGDSGGPVTKKINNIDYLVAIVSFGSSNLIDGSPDGHTRLRSYIPWMQGKGVTF